MRRVAASLMLVSAIAGCGPPAPARPPDVVAPATPAVVAPPATHAADLGSARRSWLKDHQSKDGSWDGDVASTGLALLVFLGAGETHRTGSCRETVKNGLQWLCGHQDADGCFGPRTSPRFLRDHAIAALAVTEAYGMTGTRLFKEPAQRGVAFALTTRARPGAWRRAAPDDAETDVETTGWMVMLLKSAVLSEIGETETYKATMQEAVADLDTITDRATGRARGPKGGLETAVVLVSRIFAGHEPNTDDVMRKSADAIVSDPPTWDAETDLERTYFGTLAILHTSRDRWAKWDVALRGAVLDRQRMASADAERGSWDPVGVGEFAGDRVRATALCCLMMEVYYGPSAHVKQDW